MLKTVSSITNAIGALNFKGTWDANANSPALASSVGTKGDYYVVGTAGSTNLNGISNWGIGDLATFNGSVWQRVEGGADLNGVNLSVSGTSTLSGLTASTALALNASKQVVSVPNAPAFNANLSGDQSISSATFTNVGINSETFDTNSNFDTSTNRFTPNVAGYYSVNGQISAASSSGVSRCFSSIFKNGSAISAGVDNAPLAGGTSSLATALVYMNGTTDYLELYGYITATTPVVFGQFSGYTFFNACFVRQP
jgi:hypothetical protein